MRRWEPHSDLPGALERAADELERDVGEYRSVLLAKAEAAAETGHTVRTIERWIERGDLAATVDDGTTKVRRGDLYDRLLRRGPTRCDGSIQLAR